VHLAALDAFLSLFVAKKPLALGIHFEDVGFAVEDFYCLHSMIQFAIAIWSVLSQCIEFEELRLTNVVVYPRQLVGYKKKENRTIILMIMMKWCLKYYNTDNNKLTATIIIVIIRRRIMRKQQVGGTGKMEIKKAGT